MNKKEPGFTLLELLLVVAILAVIATLAIKTYRGATESNRSNKASLELQHVLEAAIAYYADNNSAWPTENADINSGCTVAQNDPFVQNYLPNQNNLSNFGTNFCWSGGTVKNPSPRFWVALKIPKSNLDTSIYINTAKRIAAALPNGMTTTDPTLEASSPATDCSNNTSSPCYVKAEVIQPVGSGSSLVQAIGYCMPSDPNTSGSSGGQYDSSIGAYLMPAVPSSTPGVSCQQEAAANTDPPGSTADTDAKLRLQYVIHFACSQSETPQLFITPNFITEPRFDWSDSGAFDTPLFVLQMARQGSATKYTCSNASQSCTITLDATIAADKIEVKSGQITARSYTLTTHRGSGSMVVGGDGWPQYPGSVGATYIATCIPQVSNSKN